jgi:L-fuconolactonase
MTTLSAKQWRDLVQELPIDPDLPIVDAHHHVWDASPLPDVEAYSPDAFLSEKAGSGHNIVATVSVDCRTNYRDTGPEHLRILGETEYIERVANEANRRGGRYAGACAAIVPTANLLDGAAVGEILDMHRELSGRVRGIRLLTAFDESFPAPPQRTSGMLPLRAPGMIMRSDFRAGFAELVKRDMTYDAWVFQHQLDEVIDLARAFPTARIILNHLGGPIIGGRYGNDKQAAFADWKRRITAVAACDNVVLKVGGLNLKFAGVSAIGRERPRTSIETVAVQRDYILAGIEAFAPARCMFLSNFPVDMRGISYTVLWNVFKLVTRGFSAHERSDMFANVAARTYGINLPAGVAPTAATNA